MTTTNEKSFEAWIREMKLQKRQQNLESFDKSAENPVRARKIKETKRYRGLWRQKFGAVKETGRIYSQKDIQQFVKARNWVTPK